MRVFYEYVSSLGYFAQGVVATIRFLTFTVAWRGSMWKILQPVNEMQVISQLVKHFQEHVDLPGEACMPSMHINAAKSQPFKPSQCENRKP